MPARPHPAPAAPARFVVLLRGVNVGKGNKVPMAGFRALLEALGHGSVQTLLNSGNAVFTAASQASPQPLAADIAAAVKQHFGVDTPVIVKSAAEFASIVAGNPIVPPQAGQSRFLVAFTMDCERLQALEALRPLLQPGEQLAVGPQAAYLHCAGGLLQSQAGKALLGKAGRGLTTRNWATTLKLAGLLDATPA